MKEPAQRDTTASRPGGPRESETWLTIQLRDRIQAAWAARPPGQPPRRRGERDLVPDLKAEP